MFDFPNGNGKDRDNSRIPYKLDWYAALFERLQKLRKSGKRVIVMGDFNDGPGLDEYEKLFGRSGIEIVLGEAGQTELYDPHARLAVSRRVGAMPVTARFWIHSEKRYLQALLDYITVSPDLLASKPDWRIWHPFDDARCWQVSELRDALLTASDHFPLTLDIEI